MTDSDSLRGDPNHDPTRRHHPELRELDNLRALLRPHISEGTASTEEAIDHGTGAIGPRAGASELREAADRIKALEAEVAGLRQRLLQRVLEPETPAASEQQARDQIRADVALVTGRAALLDGVLLVEVGERIGDKVWVHGAEHYPVDPARLTLLIDATPEMLAEVRRRQDVVAASANARWAEVEQRLDALLPGQRLAVSKGEPRYFVVLSPGESPPSDLEWTVSAPRGPQNSKEGEP